jgi:outer membrane lipase/esterase
MYRLCCVAVFAALAGPAHAGADDFGRVVSFGDSLSDNGNLSEALTPLFSGLVFRPENFFGRFSNGPTFAELLAGGANLATGESSQQRFFGPGFILNPAPVEGSVNLAIGGAVTNDNAIPTIDLLGTGLDPIPSVEDQITAFRNAGGRFGTGDLVTILAGANDIFNAFNQNPNLAIPAAEQAAAAQIRNVDALVDAPLGARTVVVANLPNLGVIPRFNGNAQTVQQGTDATNTFNDQFDAGVEQIAAENPQANLVQADLRGALDVIIANPEAFGFVNVENAACPTGAACITQNINTFLFFDEVHPTAAGHALLAQFIDELLSTDEHGLVVAALGEVAVSTRLEASDLLFRRGVSVTYGETASGVYAEIVGQYGSGSSGVGFTDYDYQLAGIRAGFDVARGAFTFGGALAYLDGEINAARLNSDTNTAQADIYALYNFAPFFIGAEGGLSFTDFDDIRRDTTFPTVIAKSDTESVSYSLAATLGTRIETSGITLTPAVRVGYLSANVDAFSEDAPILALSFSDREIEAGFWTARLRASGFLDSERRSAAFVEAGYEQLFSVSDGYSAKLVDNTAQAVDIDPEDPEARGFFLKAGLSATVWGNATLATEYGVSFEDGDGEVQTGRVSLKIPLGAPQ